MSKPTPTLYFLPSCTSCQRVRSLVESLADWKIRNLKEEPVTEDELDDLAERVGGYEPLFSRRARLYQERGLKDQTLTEADYRRLILEHYTFFKRPVMDLGGKQVFVGASKAVVQQLVRAL